MNPLPFLLICCAGWMNRRQQVVIEYLQEEIRVLKEQLGKRPRLNDQRRRLAVKVKPVCRKNLLRLVQRSRQSVSAVWANLVTPDTLLAWHRRLIAQKYDTSQKRKPGWPRPQPPYVNSFYEWSVRIVLGVIHPFKARCRTWGMNSDGARLPKC